MCPSFSHLSLFVEFSQSLFHCTFSSYNYFVLKLQLISWVSSTLDLPDIVPHVGRHVTTAVTEVCGSAISCLHLQLSLRSKVQPQALSLQSLFCMALACHFVSYFIYSARLAFTNITVCNFLFIYFDKSNHVLICLISPQP